MDTTEKLEEWNNKHKARCCQIHIDNGYGATCWVVELHGEKGSLYACETGGWSADIKGQVIVKNEAEDYAGYYVNTYASPKTLDVCSIKYPNDWAGLKRVILAAIDTYDNVLANIGS